jgi:hypothetical protein
VPQDNLDIYDVKISGFTRSSIYVVCLKCSVNSPNILDKPHICNISGLRINTINATKLPFFSGFRKGF